MKLTFLGGADEVGASSTLIEIAGKRLLVDAGIRISSRTTRDIENDQLPDLHPISEIGGPDYILVTHAHTDHTGALPLVVEHYPHVPVLTTQPSVDLIQVLQADAQQIMRSKQESEGELPLFDEIAVQRLLDSFQVVEFNRPIRLGDGLQVTYYPSGHIIGAAAILIESEEGILMMSGDLSLSEQRAVGQAKIPRHKVDALVLESTYGGRLHANRQAEEKRLIDTLKRIVERGGRVLIPAFALGRAQEVLQVILRYRDQLSAPVFVDGMVRSVCNVYTRLADWLPENTVKRAKDEPLFFREGIKSVQNAAQREEIARANEPAIIVASSGMLTGGASVVYARHLAADERSAILLTGYQDEEAPGRKLQALARQRQAGQETTLRLDKQTITVRCEVDTYSLSAHADEDELLSIAESFDPEEVMLVHGDPAARHSLATRFRQRGRRVVLPKSGQGVVLSFAPRPWALGKVESGHESRALNPAELWEALKANAGNFYSARELAQMWWGDPARAPEVIHILTRDSLYFAADWRQRDTFRVLSPEQVARGYRQREIMLAQPDIIGKLVVLRNSNSRPRVGVVVNATSNSFEAVVHNAKGRNYPADALLWVIGPYEGPPEGKGLEVRLSSIVKQAQSLQEIIAPFEQRLKLAESGQAFNPSDMLPDTLPEDVSLDTALLAFVLGVAEDGAKLTEEGLVLERAVKDGPLEQNLARETTLTLFPPEARLRKVGMDPQRQRITLTFDFPDRAVNQYAEQIRQVMDQTGWQVVINPSVNQQSLSLLVDELLPSGFRVVKTPSLHMDKKEVHIQADGTGETLELTKTYYEITGYKLIIRKQDEETPKTEQIAAPDNAQKMEINNAYAAIKQALEPHGLYKTSLKQNQIVLTFISPQVGERYLETIAQLSEQTGYALSIHNHPNQQEILRITQQILREANIQPRKGPGIHVDRGEVAISLQTPPEESVIKAISQKLESETGYRLVIT